MTGLIFNVFGNKSKTNLVKRTRPSYMRDAKENYFHSSFYVSFSEQENKKWRSERKKRMEFSKRVNIITLVILVSIIAYMIIQFIESGGLF